MYYLQLLSMFRKADPQKSLELFKEKNPELNPSKSKPLDLAQGMLVTAANLQ